MVSVGRWKTQFKDQAINAIEYDDDWFPLIYSHLDEFLKVQGDAIENVDE